MSEPEWLLVLALRAARLPLGEAEYRFHPTRRWRLDRAWPECRLAIEIEGGVYSQGRHTRGAGFHADLEKYLEAQQLGWTVLRVPLKDVLLRLVDAIEAVSRANAERAVRQGVVLPRGNG